MSILLRLLLPALLLAWCGVAAAEPLALKRVMLSSGGVGYFEYEARVDGNATLELDLRLDQVDDALKSLVVYDDKGGIGGISLPGREPLAQAFRDLPFEQQALGSPVALLAALQGAEVTVTGARSLSGRIVGVTEERVLAGNQPGAPVIQRHRVTLMTASGLQQFVLQEAEAVQFTDPRLKAQVETALAAVAQHRAKDRRTFTIASTGQGKRLVRVAYVVGSPLWKASYRLTLPALAPGEVDAAQARADLQGWAVIENLSGQDWSGIELTLVSGNPVTFRQSLYQAYYVNRPEVPVEVMGRILPPPDKGAVAAEPQTAMRQAMAPMVAAAPPPPGIAGGMAKSSRSLVEQRARDEVSPTAIAGAAEAAVSEEAATQVVFRFPQAVSVPNGQTLTIPVVQRSVPARRLALYQPQTDARHPLAAVRLTNEAKDGQGTGLPPGVLTLYERQRDNQVAYVGDARLGALPVGEERLLSFALDQKVSVDREVQGKRTIGQGSIQRGVFRYVVTERQSTTYRFKGAKLEARSLIVEHPRIAGWQLVSPPEREVELTDGFYRLKGELPKDGTARLDVVLEQPRQESVAIAQVARDQIAAWANAEELDKPLRDAFAQLARLQAEADRSGRRLDELGQNRKRLFEDQGRLRENLARTPANSDLHRRYLAKLNEQESELEKLDLDTAKAREAEAKAREAVDAYIDQLRI